MLPVCPGRRTPLAADDSAAEFSGCSEDSRDSEAATVFLVTFLEVRVLAALAASVVAVIMSAEEEGMVEEMEEVEERVEDLVTLVDLVGLTLSKRELVESLLVDAATAEDFFGVTREEVIEEDVNSSGRVLMLTVTGEADEDEEEWFPDSSRLRFGAAGCAEGVYAAGSL